MDTIKVKPWGDDQGDFVLINESDYSQELHKLFEENQEAPKKRGPKPANQE